jgi:ADP-ribose pyrophosphatase
MVLPNDPELWQVLNSEYIASEPWFTVRKEAVKLPNQHVIPSYYVFEFPDWVNVIAVTKEKQLVMIRQYRHGLRNVFYELCAGTCDETDASPLETARRELLEETGYGNGNWQEWMVISPNPATHNNLTYCFLATDVEFIQQPELEKGEDIIVHLLSVEDVKQLLLNNEIKQALMAAPLWKYLSGL